MPKAFESVLAPTAQVWTLLQYDPSLPAEGREWGHHLRMAGRLRAGLGAEPARRELGAIARVPGARVLSAHLGPVGARAARDLHSGRRHGRRPPGSAGGPGRGDAWCCSSPASTSPTCCWRAGAARSGELSMRAALGAGRPRLIRQLVTEGLLLSFAGGALGMGARAARSARPRGAQPRRLPRTGAIRFDGAVFAFALVVTTGIGLLVGLIPALQTSRVDLHEGLRAGREADERSATGGPAARSSSPRWRSPWCCWWAPGCCCAACAGCSPWRPASRPRTCSPCRCRPTAIATTTPARRTAFSPRRSTPCAILPASRAAAFTSQLPLSGDPELTNVYGVHFEHDRDPRDQHDAFRCAVSPGYFEDAGHPAAPRPAARRATTWPVRPFRPR